jgi:hypothetical protein
MPNRYSVSRVPRIKISPHRALLMLRCKNDTEINAEQVLSDLSPKRDREVRDRFDFWIDGGVKDEYFHGWPNEVEFKECFVFKWKEKRIRHRLYGFLINPMPFRDRSFLLCVLALHVTKGAWETDKAVLRKIVKLRREEDVLGCISSEFPDNKGKVARPWLN